VDPLCEEEVAPSEWVNPDYDPLLCEDLESLTGVWEQASRYERGAGYTLEITDFSVRVRWREDRGASILPGESFFAAVDMEDAPVYAWIVDQRDGVRHNYISTSGRAFLEQGGRCPGDDRLVGFVDQVVLAEAEVEFHEDTSEYSSEFVEGGGTRCIDRLDFDQPFESSP
jgi:hypothetical protein